MPHNNTMRSLILAFIILSFSSGKVLAVTEPKFPSCANPQGEVKVSYADGIHGIVGSSSTYSGKDTVYVFSVGTYVQCFCSASGEGIQTNWWQIGDLSLEEIEYFQKEGWYYIPSGLVWGLDDVPYLAKNLPYSCLPNASPTPTPGPTETPHSDDGIGGGDIESGDDLGGSILGLAATGNVMIIFFTLALSIMLVVTGLRRLLRG